jgi:hypothetical protein
MVWLHFGGPVQNIQKQLEKNQKKTSEGRMTTFGKANLVSSSGIFDGGREVDMSAGGSKREHLSNCVCAVLMQHLD